MVNPFRDIDWQPDLPARRRFGRSLLVGFPLIGAVLALGSRVSTGRWEVWPWELAGIGAAIGAWCWAVPGLARPFYTVWYALGASIGLVVSNVFLAASYFLTVVPIGLVMRACGRDPMRRRFDPQAATYWRDIEDPKEPAQYFRQF